MSPLLGAPNEHDTAAVYSNAVLFYRENSYCKEQGLYHCWVQIQTIRLVPAVGLPEPCPSLKKATKNLIRTTTSYFDRVLVQSIRSSVLWACWNSPCPYHEVHSQWHCLVGSFCVTDRRDFVLNLLSLLHVLLPGEDASYLFPVDVMISTTYSFSKYILFSPPVRKFSTMQALLSFVSKDCETNTRMQSLHLII